MMEKKQQTLIVIPFWWDNGVDSLAATIREKRPDLLLGYVHASPKPISPVMPSEFPVVNIPDIGELMLACAPPKNIIILNWWIGEKYDGVRALWNPKITTLFSRQGKPIKLFSFFSDNFPVIFLDGEICPQQLILHAGFEKRYSVIMILLLLLYDYFHPPLLILCTRLYCSQKHYGTQYFNTIINERGEGIMARKPNSVYEHGKSHSLFKIKNVIDADAIVVKIEKDILICKLNDIEIFVANDSNFVVNIGSVVTIAVSDDSCKQQQPYRYKILRVRHDLLW